MNLPTEAQVLDRLLAWAGAQPAVRAVLLTSSRARPGGPVDLLSDYDIILAAIDVEPFIQDTSWMLAYGQPMTRWGDQGEQLGLPTSFRSAVYQDGIKIDYSLWPVALLERITAAAVLPSQLDVGYRVLLDKDGRTARWPPAAYQAHIPARPTAAEYGALVEEFWWSATYVAKSLWRDELFFARRIVDDDLRQATLRPMLEWRLELDHDWALKPGVLGRGLKRLLPAETWLALERTYVGPDLEENWQALFRLAALFRAVAQEVGQALGYAYPLAVDQQVSAYCDAIHRLPPHTSG